MKSPAAETPTKSGTSVGKPVTRVPVPEHGWKTGALTRLPYTEAVFPGTLRLLSLGLPQELPFQRNWKMNECHQM